MKNIIVAIVIVCILCTFTASALRVEIKTSSVVLPNKEFNITIKVNGSLPTVVGVALNVPKEFTLVNCTTPYKVSENSVSLAIINDTSVECTFKAPSSEGTFTIGGRWIDMLNGGEGKLEASISVGEVTTTQITTTTATLTTTIAVTKSPTATTKQTPGFEFVTAVLPLSLIALRRWFR
ncbi:hypothetical protein [Archaeoglobus sp.]